MNINEIIQELLIEFHKETLQNYINGDEMRLNELAESYAAQLVLRISGYKQGGK